MTHKELMVQYLKQKVELEDWHGVADAACDLRVLEAEDFGRQKVYEMHADKISNPGKLHT
jgi:hypothetical protein